MTNAMAQAPTATMSAARRNLCVALLVLLGFSLGCSEFVVIGIETELAEAFNVSLQHVGLTVSSFAITYAICTPLLALSTGRLRRYTLLVAYAALFCVGNVISVVAPTFEVLLASRVLIGAVSGAYLAVGVTFLPELLGRGNTSMAISVVYGAFSVAMVISTSMGKIVADALGWHAAMVLVLVFAVLVSAALLLFLPRQGSTDEPATLRDQIGLLAEPAVLAGIAIFVFGVGAVYVFYGYITPYLEQVMGLSALQVSGVLVGYGVACLFSNMLSGWSDARFGMKALIPAFLVQALLLLALFALQGAMPASLAVVILIALSMYVLSVPCVSMFMKVSYDRHPKALTLASSVEPMAFNIGIAFGTAIGGMVVAGPGLHYSGVVGAVFDVVACGLTLLCIHLLRVAHERQMRAAAAKS